MKEKELKEGLPEDSSQGIDRRGFLSAAGAFGATALIHSSAENLFAAEKKIPAKGPSSKEKKEWPVESIDWQKGFYEQKQLTSHGILVKAPKNVHPMALKKAAFIVEKMLENADPEIIERLSPTKLEDAKDVSQIAIIPAGSSLADLPEFKWLKGKLDINRVPYEKVRGAGAVPGQPVSATSEENLMGYPTDAHKMWNVTCHEFGHAIERRAFTEEQHKIWDACFAQNRNKWGNVPGDFLRQMPDNHEYWAKLTQVYFQANDVGNPFLIQQLDPAAYRFLESVYNAKKPQPKKGRR